MGKPSDENQTVLRRGKRGITANRGNKNMWNMQGTLNGINFETNARLGTAADRVLPSTSLEIRVEAQQQQQNSDDDNDVDDDKMTEKSLTVHHTLQSAVMTKEHVC